jgi:exopolysaccharide biosynthesis polyprenyl glycosylphosphotransferase
MKNRHAPELLYKFTLFACDTAVSIGSFTLVLWWSGWNVFLNHAPGIIISLIILSITVISFFPTYHLYNYHFLFSRKEHFKNLGKSFCWSLLTFCIIIFLFKSSSLLKNGFSIFTISILIGAAALLLLSRYLWNHFLDFMMSFGIALLIMGMTGLFNKENIPDFMSNADLLIACFILAVIVLTANRIFLVHVVFNNWLRRRFRRQVLIVGSGSDAEKIANHIFAHNAPFWIVGTVGPKSPPEMENYYQKQCIGKLEDLSSLAECHQIDDLIIIDERIDKPTLVSILDFCTAANINAWFSPKLLPIIKIKLYIDNFCGIPMILLCTQKNTWFYDIIKHILDVLLSSLLLIALSPLFLLIILAIKMNSPGPILYRARAIGKGGKVFNMYKFRSMEMNTDNAIHKEYVSKLIKGEIGKDNQGETPLKITDDPRVTRVGRILRKLSLDEFPQLINVLKGEMSLVGPRPCLPYEFDLYQDWCKKRTAASAGITGIWQITGRSAVSFEDMILLDLYYLYNRRISFDLNILLETIFVVLGKKGAY